jgi:hypothetical protein
MGSVWSAADFDSGGESKMKLQITFIFTVV